MKRTALFLGALVLATGAVAAHEAAKLFSFKDPKGVNTMTFKLDSAVEPIKGFASGISGDIQFDPAKPEATRGSIVVDVKSMTVPNPRMNGFIQSEGWMNGEKFPTITFAIVEVKDVKREPGTKQGDLTSTAIFSANVVGDFTMKGVTKRMTVPATLTYFADGLGRRVGNLEGDLAVIRTNFKINRMDFGVDGRTPIEVVSDIVEIDVAIAGGAAR